MVEETRRICGGEPTIVNEGDEMVEKATEAVTSYKMDVKNRPPLREFKPMAPEEADALEASLAEIRAKDTDPRVY